MERPDVGVGALGDAGSPPGELMEGPALNTVFSVFSK